MRANEKAHKVLMEKALQVTNAANLISNKINDWQVIKTYMNRRINEIELTPEQEKKLERYYFIYNQQVKGKYSELDIVAQLMNLPGGVSKKQAYEDISCAQELFNSSIIINKQYKIKIELQIAEDMRRKCVEIGDFKTAAVVQKNIIALQAMLPDEEDNAGYLFEGHEIEAVFDPRLLDAPAISTDELKELLQSINSKRKVAVNMDFFETIPFEENK